MYFKFFELHSWGKRSVDNRRQFHQRLLGVRCCGLDVYPIRLRPRAFFSQKISRRWNRDTGAISNRPPCFSFSIRRKGTFAPVSFSPSEKETVSSRQRKRGRGETFRMVSPHPFYRPEPCSGLAAYGSQKIYDRVCRGRCRAQLFATKERYRCGLPLAGTHRPASVGLAARLRRKAMRRAQRPFGRQGLTQRTDDG